MFGEWTGFDAQLSYSSTIQGPLQVNTGNSLYLQSNNAGGGAEIGPWRTLGTNYARCTGTAYVQQTFGGNPGGLVFRDATTAQVSITIEASGAIGFRRGNTTGTLVASGGSVVNGSIHCLAWDITFHSSAGIVKVWLDGALISALNLTSQNTAPSGHNYINTIKCGMWAGLGTSTNMHFDHTYWRFYISSGGTDPPPLTNAVVLTSYPSSDSSVAFTASAGVLGAAYSIVATTNAPGANELALRKFTPVVNATINSISIVPGATSAGAKLKGVIYSDSAGSAGSLLSSGTEVVGTTSGTTLTLPLVTPQSLTASTPVWIGYITDTSVVINEQDSTTLGFKAANTYASGAPGTAPAMTSGQPSWQLWGNCTGMAANWPQVAQDPTVGSVSYNSNSIALNQDLFGFPSLTADTIYTAAVKAFVENSGAGASTINLITKSSATQSNGDTAGQAPSFSFNWFGSYFDLDPNGSISWTSSALNAATSGYEIATIS